MTDRFFLEPEPDDCIIDRNSSASENSNQDEQEKEDEDLGFSSPQKYNSLHGIESLVELLNANGIRFSRANVGEESPLSRKTFRKPVKGNGGEDLECCVRLASGEEAVFDELEDAEEGESSLYRGSSKRHPNDRENIFTGSDSTDRLAFEQIPDSEDILCQNLKDIGDFSPETSAQIFAKVARDLAISHENQEFVSKKYFLLSRQHLSLLY